jgi:hypothetical protein
VIIFDLRKEIDEYCVNQLEVGKKKVVNMSLVKKQEGEKLCYKVLITT